MSDLSGSHSVSLTSVSSLELVVGVDLSTRQLQTSTPLALLNSGLGVQHDVRIQAANLGPANGRLAANLNFTLLVNGSQAIPVTLAQSTTSDNDTLDDLAADLSAAIAAANPPFEQPIFLLADNGRLQLATSGRDIRNVSISGASAIGFANGQSGNLPDMIMYLANGNAIPVNLDGAETLGDIIATLEQESAGQVEVTIDPQRESLVLLDQTSGSSVFSIEATNNSLMATGGFGLALVGSDDDQDGTLSSGSLGLSTIETRMSLSDVNLHGQASFNDANVNLSGRLGFLGVDIPRVDGQAIVDVQLLNPVTGVPGDSATLAELAFTINADPQSIVDASSSGATTLHLVASGGYWDGSPSIDPTLEFTWSPLTVSTTPNVVGNADLDGLNAHADLTFAEIVDALNAAASFVATQDPAGDLDSSLAGIMNLGPAFSAAVSQLAASQAATIQQVRAKIAAAFNVSANSVAVTGSEEGVRLQLDFAKNLSGQTALYVDLEKLQMDSGPIPELAGITHLTETSQSINVSGSTSLSLDLGIDLSNSAQPTAYLFDTSALHVNVADRRTNLFTSAALGALDVNIAGGSRVFDRDGNGATNHDPVTFDVSFTGDANGRVDLNDANSSRQVQADGQLVMSLPLFHPEDDSPLGELTVTIADLDTAESSTTVQFTGDVSAQVAGVDFTHNVPGVIEGIDSLLEYLAEQAQDHLVIDTLPWLGELVSAENFAVTFLEDLRPVIRDALFGVGQGGGAAGGGAGGAPTPPAIAAGQLRQVLFNTLKSNLDPDFSDDSPGPDVTPLIGDILVTPDIPLIANTTNEVIYDFHLQWSGTTAVAIPRINFGPIQLAYPAGTMTNVNWSVDVPVRFGVSRVSGFFVEFDVDANPNPNVVQPLGTGPLVAHVDSSLPAVPLVGTFNNVPVTITDNAVTPSSASADSRLDLGPAGTRLTVAGLGLPAIPTQADVQANARLDIDLEAGFNAAFPSLAFGLRALWSFDDTITFNPPTPPSAFGSLDLFEIQDIAVDRRGLFDFLDDQLMTVQAQISNFRDAVGSFIDPLPVFDRLGLNVNIFDVFALFGLHLDAVETLFRVVDGVLGLPSYISDVRDELDLAPNQHLLLGTFRYDHPTPLTPSLGITDIDFASLSYTSPGVGSLHDQLVAGTPSGSWQRLWNALHNLGGTGTALDIPLIEDPEIFYRLITSLDPNDDIVYDLFTLDLPEMTAGIRPFTFNIPVFGGLVNLRFDFDNSNTLDLDFPTLPGPTVYADFDLGFDTFGLEQYLTTEDSSLISEGFYLDDRVQPDGTDLPEIIGDAGAFVSLGGGAVISFSAGGGVIVEVLGDVDDPNRDGIARLSELESCALDITGEISGVLFVSARIGLRIPPFGFVGVEKRLNIASKVLYRFDEGCDPPPILAHQEEDGVLKLHLGPDFALRNDGSEGDTSESFFVRRGESGGVVVEYNGYASEEFMGVSEIRGNGGEGNDVIQVDEDVFIPVQLFGGPGNDRLQGGGLSAELWGGSGNDTLTLIGPEGDAYGESGN
ncbi:MAG: hypothetical protein KDA60_13445, partial [Planctomycetales bacterium]|nr:hypothetical protein [Planctomycetales bacterium]